MVTNTRLAPVPASAAEARHFVERTLRGWGCDQLIDSAQLIVTELVSNAVQHTDTSGAIDLSIELHPGVLRISLGDDGADGLIDVVRTDVTSECGRGLRLVEGLSDCWGVERFEPDHKTVWAELRVPT